MAPGVGGCGCCDNGDLDVFFFLQEIRDGSFAPRKKKIEVRTR